MNTRILFVDDESRVLEGLKRMLHNMRNQWDMAFVESGEKALELLSKESFDVIISDMRMPGMNGADLLNKVMKCYPKMARFILSGRSDQHLILNCVGSAHQYLSKPCDPRKLKAALARASSLRDLLANERLAELASQLQSLPSLPTVYIQLLQEMQSPDASIAEIGRIISADIGMSAKILQLVNSAFFGLPRRVSSPAQAASLLGVETIRGMMLSIHVFSVFQQKELSAFSLTELWNHSAMVGTFARKIAKLERCDDKCLGDNYIAGLLHDIGKLVLAYTLPDQYARALEIARTDPAALAQAETETLGLTHAEIGAYLLGLWAFPDHVVEAAAYHHRPSECAVEGFSPLLAVHVADALDHELNTDNRPGTSQGLDFDYISNRGFAQRVGTWRDACKSIVEGEKIEHETENSLC
jgi:HD-like signal output (HDOD) protein